MVDQIVESIVEVFISAPIFLRFHYVLKVSFIIDGFNKQVEPALAKAKRMINLILAFFAFVVAVMVVYFIIILSNSEYLDFICFCTDKYSPSRLVSFLNRLVLFLIELFLFIFYICKLRKRQVKVKYKILFELVVVCSLWLALKFLTFSKYLFADCNSFYNDLPYQVAQIYFTLFMHVLIFSFTILTPLMVSSAESEPRSQKQLVLEFPESLYFWTPNYYFNKYLIRQHPDLVNYRPLMADILRYDFQIDEVASSRPDSSVVSFDFKGQGYSKEMLSILKLVRYIKERYFSPLSDNYCDFKSSPEVLENILEKYDNLGDNLDDFLFEFQRAYVESILAPKYKLFIDSQQFSEMLRDMQTEDMFEWILTHRAS